MGLFDLIKGCPLPHWIFVLFRGEDSTAPGPTTVYRFVPSFYTEDLLCLNTDCNSKLILGLFFKSETQNSTTIDFAVCSWPKLKVQ